MKPIFPKKWKMTCEHQSLTWKNPVSNTSKPSSIIIVFHCVCSFVFLCFQHAGQFHCSGLKLWILLKEAQTTEEKWKEASYENQDTDVPGFSVLGLNTSQDS